MAPKKSSIVLNVEQFIHDVEERPAIWNRNYHCNKAFLEQMWEELSAAHKLPKVVLKAKWKGLRDNFRVEYKRIPRADNGDFLLDPATFESKWIHYYALLFLTEHMRHRMPKNEQESSSLYYPQQGQECEKTIVEPDLTNGLIRIPDSDEEFDEDDIDDDDDDEANEVAHGTSAHRVCLGISAGSRLAAVRTSLETPPAAHLQPPLNSSGIKIEDASSTTRSLLRPLKELQKQTPEKQAAEDLSKKTAAAAVVTDQMQMPMVTATAAAAVNLPNVSASVSTTVSTLVHQFSNAAAPHKKRSVSPPPLYNKAHHVAPTALTAAALSKERDDYSHQLLNGSGGSLHGSHEHLNFTKNSYANGIIPAIKLKRPRLSEDSNFNGSSTMDNTSSLVPEDDDYHYLLSLHPYMKQLNAAQKLRIRTKIQKLIFKELYKEDLEETK